MNSGRTEKMFRVWTSDLIDNHREDLGAITAVQSLGLVESRTFGARDPVNDAVDPVRWVAGRFAVAFA